ncbi:MAG: outer membrane beta-barrel protein [Opitutales bacterium]|nr:outer membrane beta-barrel protein [Opitutales bacterium]
MKRIFQTASVGIFAFTAPAQALFYIAGNEVMLNTMVSLQYDTNIFANAEEEGDFVARGSIGLSYTRPYRFFDIGGSVSLYGTRHMDFTDNDRLNWRFNFFVTPTAEFGTRYWTLSTDIGFQRTTRSDEDLGDLVTTDNYRGGLTLTITPTSRYFVETGFLYSITDPRDSDLPEIHTLDTHVAAGWSLGPRYFIFGQVNRTKTDVKREDSLDNVVWNYSVGLRGEFTPRLNGQATVGISRRKLDLTGETDETPTYSVALNYMIDRQTNATLTGSRTFTSSLARNNMTRTTVNLGLNRVLREGLRGALNTGFVERRYDGDGIDDRRDRAYSAGGSLTYDIAAWGSLTGGVSHTVQDSNVAFFDYHRTLIYLTLTGSF